MSGKNKIKAFTLAEVLITLMVIGVLAVATIPSLVQSWEEQATVAKLKKTYSTLQQAFQLAEIDKGGVASWVDLSTGPDMTKRRTFASNLVSHLQLVEDCTVIDGLCSHPSIFYSMFGDLTNDFTGAGCRKARTIDDVNIFINFLNTCSANYGDTQELKSVCAYVYVDLNGAKPPNRLGRDIFEFYLTTYGFLPSGSKSVPYALEHNCAYNSTIRSSNGALCTAWVIERGNMDYLHKTITW